jgi:hypothetical protein
LALSFKALGLNIGLWFNTIENFAVLPSSEVVLSKTLIVVKHNTVAGIYFKVDGKVILGAKFKNYKLTWDYGTNMQPNDNKGSITFSEVFLDGNFSPQTPE